MMLNIINYKRNSKAIYLLEACWKYRRIYFISIENNSAVITNYYIINVEFTY